MGERAPSRLCTFALLGACRRVPAQIGLFCRIPSRGLVRRRLLWVRRSARLVAFAAGSRWFGGGFEPVLIEGLLDAPGGGGAEALVDRECLPQVLRGFGEIAVVEVAVADSFQGAGFLCGHADVAGNGQRPGVLVAGLADGRGPGR